MKILELTNYTAGSCGVWARVKQESLELARKGHDIIVFSSNAVKGADEIAKSEENLAKIKIKRFPFRKLGGESFMLWDFESAAAKLQPAVIVAHSYRHPHTHKAIKVAEKLKASGKKCQVFLVTHAPFARNETRTPLQSFIVWFYDLFISRSILNKFDKILAITHWEMPYLLKLGAEKKKIIYLPNGIPDEFFQQRKARAENKILFLGRIAPIKNIETAIEAISRLKDKKIFFEIVGPAEESYLKKLNKLIEKLKLSDRVKFSAPVYNLKEKIKKIDSARIFVLPSISEGMPQSLIEAMARGKIVIVSNNKGNSDIIKNGKNGFLFETENSGNLADKVNLILSMNKKGLFKIKKSAGKTAQEFRWSKLVKKLENLF